jgi:uncharacterized protein (DUF1778 family)
MSTKTRATKDRRWETRVDEELDALVNEAAATLGVKPAVFVRDAALQHAQRTLARADITLMDDALFDELMGSLEVADAAPTLERLARKPRSFRRG